MTTLEIILISIIWIGYGLFSVYQRNERLDFEKDILQIFLVIIGSPLILITRIFIGIFSSKVFD